MKKYSARLLELEKEYEFLVEKKETSFFVINKKKESLDIIISKISRYSYSLLINNISYIINIQKNNSDYVTTVRGRQYDVTLENRQIRAQKMHLKPSAPSKLRASIKAPMPGLILGCAIKEGKHVKKGDTLFILSAMKMENEIKSSHSGIIQKILCQENDTVNKGQVLAVFQ